MMVFVFIVMRRCAVGELRQRFESKLSERVKHILIECDFNSHANRYYYCDLERKDDFNLGVINGAWFMFQEQQSKIEGLEREKTEITQLVQSLRNEFDLNSDCPQVERQIELLEKALRGES